MLFEAPEFESQDIGEGFDIPEIESHDICEGFDVPEFESHGISTEAAGVAAYYVCTTKVGFPATEAPGVPSVLRLYYKSRLPEDHFESPKEHTGPRQYYFFCTTKDVVGHKKNAKTRRFCTATTPKPAEGCPRKARNVKKETTVLAPRPCRNPQRVVRGQTTVLAPRPRRNPQMIVRGAKET